MSVFFRICLEDHWDTHTLRFGKWSLPMKRLWHSMFKDICFEIASAVWMHPELASLLNRASETSHLKAIIVTCGLKKTWEKVLQLAKLDDAVQVIRGGRLRDGYVVDEAVKAHLVSPSKQELSICMGFRR